MSYLEADVTSALKRQLPKLTRRDLEKRAKQKFNKLKQEMINEFRAHPITQEILAGPNASNISGTLGGTSNLFAFIGFSQGSSPITPILEILERVTLQYDSDLRGSAKGYGVNLKVNLPTAEEIFAITPLPWASGRSWAEGIERGISGLGYLVRKSGGRSGAAVQSRVKKIRGGGFQNTAYISSFIRKYKKRFEELK